MDFLQVSIALSYVSCADSKSYLGTKVHVQHITSDATTATSNSPTSEGSGSPRSVTPPRQSAQLPEEDKITALLKEASLESSTPSGASTAVGDVN